MVVAVTLGLVALAVAVVRRVRGRERRDRVAGLADLPTPAVVDWTLYRELQRRRVARDRFSR